MEMAHNYDGQGLKGALWTVAGTAIANTAQNFLSGGCGGGLLGGLFGGNACGGAAWGGANPALLAENAKLSAELDTDRKVIAAWDNLNTKIQAQAIEDAILKQRVACLEATLAAITSVRVPGSVVCGAVPTATALATATTTTPAAGA